MTQAETIGNTRDAVSSSRASTEGREVVNRQRWYMLFVIGGLFVILNGAVIWLIAYALKSDIELIAVHANLADKRLITSIVLQTLVGATVVQTGAITWAMARYLFPNQPD